MAIIGVSKPYAAVYSATAGVVTYSDGLIMGKLTEVNIEIESSEDNNLYADNTIAETDRQFTGGTLTIAPDDLSSDVSATILGITPTTLTEVPGITDSNAEELIYNNTQAIPYLGVGFIVKKMVGGAIKWRGIVLTKVMFSVPSDAAVTQGETIEWQVPELTATIMRDDTGTQTWKREATFTTEAQAEAYIKYVLGMVTESSGS